VLITANKKHGEIYITFILKVYKKPYFNPVYNVETIVWNEKAEKWTTLLTHYNIDQNGLQIPVDCYGTFGDTLVSFMNGELWLENDNPLFNNFFGDQKEMIIDVVSNADFEKIKVFQEIGLSTNNNVYNPANPDNSWSCPIITIPDTEINPNGQQSWIDASRFRQKEESIYADIPRNIKSKMAGTDLYKLVNGDVLRGQAMVVRLRNKNNSKVLLYSVITKFINSELSK
jgi:hypothetical protein